MRFLTQVGASVAVVAASTGIVHAEARAPRQRPLIQIAILLDTSNSMDGLINQARAHLWNVVNELATSKQGGKTPELRVALYEYGKSSIPASEGHLRQIVTLTTDLDKVSEELFALTTNGGAEYCGQVIRAAVDGLPWSASNKDYKAIFIAGNEPFTQGSVDYRKSCKAAIQKGVIVNTIHCGPRETGIGGKWRDGSLLADGQYMNINQNQAIARVAAPQDKQIVSLNAALNSTYIPFGALGAANSARQRAQDANAAGMSMSSGSSRAQRKPRPRPNTETRPGTSSTPSAMARSSSTKSPRTSCPRRCAT